MITSELALTLPTAHKILFLMTEAMRFMNSVDVAQGSMQVVMMYLTGVSLFELSWIKEGKKGIKCKSVSKTRHSVNHMTV